MICGLIQYDLKQVALQLNGIRNGGQFLTTLDEIRYALEPTGSAIFNILIFKIS